MNIKRVTLLVLCVLIVNIFCSCSKEHPPKTESIPEAITPQNGGTVNMGCVTIDTLNPLTTRHASISDFLSLVYEGLFVTKSDLTAEPVLADDYSVSKENTVYTIKLKKDISFHNGQKLTSKDVMATIEYLSMYPTRWSNVISYIEGCTSDGDYSVVIKLNSSKSDFVANLDFPILPAGLMAEDFALPNSDFVPIGTGMYKYSDRIAHKNIILKVNEAWKNGSHRPYIDKVNVEILSDEETLISAFDAGTIDTLTTSWQNFNELKLASTLFNTFSFEQNRYTYLGINTSDEIFDTPKERRILKNSIDSSKITEDIILGNGVAATSPVRDTAYFNSESTNEESDNTNDANSTSAESEPIECQILYNADSKTKSRIAASLKQQLESRGYFVTLDGQDLQTYTDRVLLGEYQLYVGEVQMIGSCDLSFMFSSPTNGFCLLDDEELRNLLVNIDMAVGNKEKEMAWENFERYYTNLAVQVPLFFSNGATFVNKGIKGSLKPNLSNPFYGFENMFIM